MSLELSSVKNEKAGETSEGSESREYSGGRQSEDGLFWPGGERVKKMQSENKRKTTSARPKKSRGGERHDSEGGVQNLPNPLGVTLAPDGKPHFL